MKVTVTAIGGADLMHRRQRGRSALTPLGGWIDASPVARFFILSLFAFLIRAPMFGEWNFDVDDQFYFLVGQRILDGATLYVDIWDRKGPMLFVLFAGIAAISRDAIAFQIAATISAILGAWGIQRIAQLMTGPRGSFMAGIAYLALLNRFGGATAQTPVFYNTLMIFAVWTIVTRFELLSRGRIDSVVVLGMASAGLAIGIKQSAVIESAFFGIAIVALLANSNAPRGRLTGQITLLAFVGTAPYLIASLWYWHIGHFDEFWHATVGSNFQRLYEDDFERFKRFFALLGQLDLPIAFAFLGVRALKNKGEDTRLVWFIVTWACVALFAIAIFPNIYSNYALPMLPPLCMLSAIFFNKYDIAKLGLAVLVILNLWFANSFDFATRWRAHEVLPRYVSYVKQETPNGRLFIWGKASLLYAEAGTKPPTRLAFPHHLYDGAEAGASDMDEIAEVRRILGKRPETVVAQADLNVFPANEANIAQVEAYLERCKKRKHFTIYDREGPIQQIVYSRCAVNEG